MNTVNLETAQHLLTIAHNVWHYEAALTQQLFHAFEATTQVTAPSN